MAQRTTEDYAKDVRLEIKDNRQAIVNRFENIVHSLRFTVPLINDNGEMVRKVVNLQGFLDAWLEYWNRPWIKPTAAYHMGTAFMNETLVMVKELQKLGLVSAAEGDKSSILAYANAQKATASDEREHNEALAKELRQLYEEKGSWAAARKAAMRKERPIGSGELVSPPVPKKLEGKKKDSIS